MRKLILLAAALAAGCSLAPNAVRNRATFDLGCPEDRIDVVSLGGGVWGAKGCNKRASYVFPRGTLTPILEGVQTDNSQAGPATERKSTDKI